MTSNWDEVQSARRKEEMAKLKVEYMQQQERGGPRRDPGHAGGWPTRPYRAVTPRASLQLIDTSNKTTQSNYAHVVLQ